MLKNPSVSVVILNYNGRKKMGEDCFLKCVSSVLNSNYLDFEVVFVDNGSTDGSARFVKENLCGNPRVKLVANPQNYGFSKGNNIAMKYTNGDYIALLNNDVEVEPDWLLELVKVMEADSRIGIAQSKILSSDRVHIQTIGLVLDTTLSTWHIGRNQKDVGQYDKACEITFASGAALIMRRSLIKRIGLFDPSYFFYHDDCDLGWRARLSGYKNVYVPSSVVYHKGGGTSKTTITEHQRFYLLIISRIGLLIKNPELKNLLKLGTLLSLSISMDFLGMLLKGDLQTPTRLILWTLKNFRHNWRSRLAIQNQIRKVADDEIFKTFLDSHILVLLIRKRFDKIIRRKFYESLDELANQATDTYYSSHLYSGYSSNLGDDTGCKNLDKYSSMGVR